MKSLTKKEKETLLILLKDFTSFYNANSISKVLKISHVWAQKIFKRLLRGGLVTSKTIGKSIVYKPNFNDVYVCQLLAFLLADEANDFKRWKEEFKEFFKGERIVILFGSIVKDYLNARDIDLMIVIEKKELNEINAVLKHKEELLPKKIHAIKMIIADLSANLKKSDKVLLNIVKNGVVLYGQENYIEVLKNVTSA